MKPATAVNGSVAAPIPANKNDEASAPSRPFSGATLESLLTAELAAQRQRPDITLSNYIEQARETRDVGVVARATTIAQVLNQPQSLEMAQLWAEVAPESADAWYLVTLNSLRQLRFDTAIPALDRLIVLQPEADLEQLFLAAIPVSQTARDDLFNKLGELARTHPGNAHLLFGQALLKAQSGKPAEAMEIARRARLLRPQSTQITLLEAKMLTELNRNREAADLLQEALKSQPESHNLRLNYARALIRAGDMNGAEREFQTLVGKLPQDDGLRLSLALIAFDNHHDETAARELGQLRNSEGHGDEARYYLGMLALRQDKKDEALAAFEDVPPGTQYLPALAEISRLLVAGGHVDEARNRLAQARSQTPELRSPLYQLEAELLNEAGNPQAAWDLLDAALKEQPEDTQLLLSRAMAAEQLNRLDDFESDMREVLRYEPNNPSALNGLGYTLIDRTSRLDEGEGYILRAQALKPDDPAIIDSVGWLKFMRGDRSGALLELRRAYALYPDDEIAAHLGEVLWASGQHDEARRIWSDALRQHPKSTHIPKTRQRLDPSR
ncbi:MAG: tetratricopeptide repeat protein [bacterium]|nr:tetratricopeptide repeat protein [bacterium]